MGSLTNNILNFPTPLALFLIFLLPALESSIFAGFIFPGETAVVIGGVLASQHKIPLLLTIVVASAGAILGDSVGYFVGRKWGHRLLEKASGRFLKPSRINQAEGFVSRRGGPGVFIGRFTTVLRVLVPGVAGMAGMKYLTFLIFNVLGGISWAIVYSYVGYFAGSSFVSVEKSASTVGLVVVAAIVIIVALFFLYRYLKEFKKETPEATGSPNP